MIYLIYGTDTDKTRAKARELVDTLLTKKPDAAFFKLTSENWQAAALDEYIGSQGLFENKYIVLADTLLENKEVKEIVVDKLKDIKASQNVFIFREGALDKATLGKFEKNAQKVQECGTKEDAVGKKGKQDFNIFQLTDAFGRRDKKTLWTLYTKAKRAGLEDEQIHGTLFWQVKSMLLAKTAGSAKEAGLNPFVFGKAQGFAQSFSEEELVRLSAEMVALYHDAHRGISDLDVSLERFILSM